MGLIDSVDRNGHGLTQEEVEMVRELYNLCDVYIIPPHLFWALQQSVETSMNLI